MANPLPRSQNVLASRSFVPLAVSLSVAGHASDLWSTWSVTPTLDQESNPLYLLLAANGLAPGWPGLLLSKALFVAATSGALWSLVRLRASLYPRAGEPAVRFLLALVVTKSASGWLPRPRVLALLLVLGAVGALSSPLAFAVAADNMAHAWVGWFLCPNLPVGGALFLFVRTAALAVLLRMLWVDYNFRA